MLFAASDAQTATILIGIGTILSAIIGPIMANQFAHQAATAEQRRRDVLDVCGRVYRDSLGILDALKHKVDDSNPTSTVNAAFSLTSTLIALESDMLLLELIFGPSSDRLRCIIQEMLFDSTDVHVAIGNDEDFASVALKFSRHNEALKTELQKLWKNEKAQGNPFAEPSC